MIITIFFLKKQSTKMGTKGKLAYKGGLFGGWRSYRMERKCKWERNRNVEKKMKEENRFGIM